MTKKILFKKGMTFAQALKKHKGVIKVFDNYKLMCASCMGMTEESLEIGAINHGIDPDEFLKELNKLK